MGCFVYVAFFGVNNAVVFECYCPEVYEIIGNEPLLGRLEDTSHSDAQKQAREDVHEQLSTSPEQRAADMQQLEALLNIGDRVALFREQHDLVSGAQ